MSGWLVLALGGVFGLLAMLLAYAFDAAGKVLEQCGLPTID